MPSTIQDIAKSQTISQALSITPVLSSPIEARDFDGTRPQPGIECQTFILPNFDDCRSIISGNSYFGGDPFSVCVNPRVCRIWREGNCRISFCNNEDTEECSQNTEWGQRTNEIIDFCGPSQGGYESAAEPAPWTEVAVRANTDFFAFSATAAHPAYEELSVEENAREVKALEQLKSSSKLQARADSFQIGNRRLNTERPGSQKEVSGVLQNGALFTVEESNTVTEGITASVSLGSDLFGIMTAEIGISVSSEYSVTSSAGVQIPIDCGNSPSGVVVWFPLFDYYEGTFQPSGEPGSIWIPLDSTAATGNYRVRCLG